MMTTFDFGKWIDNLVTTELEQIHNLYLSVEGETEIGAYSTRKEDGKLLVSTPNNTEPLLIPSSLAKWRFLTMLDSMFSGEFDTVKERYNANNND